MTSQMRGKREIIILLSSELLQLNFIALHFQILDTKN